MREKRYVGVLLILAFLLAASVSARADPPPRPGTPPPSPVPKVARSWPLRPRPTVIRSWAPPPTPYGRGHRGVDLTAPAGAPVRAVAAGRVSYAGPVAGRGVISVELAGTGTPPLRTTYEPVRPTVREGDEVAPGEPLGTVQPTGSHCPPTCLHWGLRRADTYLDPLLLLPRHLLRRGPPVLLPVVDTAASSAASPAAVGRRRWGRVSMGRRGRERGAGTARGRSTRRSGWVR
ncbi:murein hydrolase activator EnvC family protein [Streptomyces sp. bgisy159]|uniref:murein hydrolase activator EnvC family protein n=1 Tax=Streptomyces sp. bgisy159 TaxID=3413795 RepID=UPI003F49BB84